MQDQGGRFPIHSAASESNVNFILELIKNKADVNSLESDGYNPISCACLHGLTKNLLALINANADVNYCHINSREFMETTFDFICDKPEVTKILICNGASLVNQKSKILRGAAAREISRQLQLQEVQSDVENFSTFIWLILYEDLVKLNTLYKFENLSDVIADKTSLMFAQKYDKKESIKFLLDKILPVVELIRSEICIPLPLAKLIGHYLFG